MHMGEMEIRFLNVMSFITSGDKSFDIFDILISDDLMILQNITFLIISKDSEIHLQF